jgi:PAS domain S-box-containing protein
MLAEYSIPFLSDLPWQEITTLTGGIIILLLKVSDTKLKKILSETRTNGGSSLKDQLNKIERKLEHVNLSIETGQNLSNKPMFKADKDGECVWANTVYSRITGRTMEELKGAGWINIICKHDLERVVKEWEFAIHKKIIFQSEFCITTGKDNKRFKVAMTAHPILYDHELLGYLGTWESIEELK